MRRAAIVALLAGGLVVGGSSTAAGTAAPKPAPAKSAAAKPAKKKPVLPFVEDDYAAALAQARARRVPLFIEAWAPW